PSYAQPVPIGGVMEGGTVSEVIASNNPAFTKGDIVLSRAGWQTHAISDGKGLAKIDPKIAPISTAVGVLGMPGMTAYTGLLDISQWVREGKVKHKEFVTEGLDSAPAAFMGLLKGANFGKQLVRVGPDKI